MVLFNDEKSILELLGSKTDKTIHSGGDIDKIEVAINTIRF